MVHCLMKALPRCLRSFVLKQCLSNKEWVRNAVRTLLVKDPLGLSKVQQGHVGRLNNAFQEV